MTVRDETARLQERDIGQAGLRTSVLALGCARLGSTLARSSDRESVALLNEALDLGVRHFDTASIYGQGDSEKLIGRALGARRSEVCLATKAGQRLSALQASMALAKTPARLLARLAPAIRQQLLQQRAQGIDLCFRPEFLQRSLERSLRRLRTDHVDIFYLHSPSKLDLQREDLWRRAEQWRLDGKIRALGVSCDDLAIAEYCASLPHISIVQLDVADRRRSAAALNAIRRHGKIAIARGVARYYIEMRHDTGNFFTALRAAAAIPAVAAVIVETSRREHLQQNVAAMLQPWQGPAAE